MQLSVSSIQRFDCGARFNRARLMPVSALTPGSQKVYSNFWPPEMGSLECSKKTFKKWIYIYIYILNHCNFHAHVYSSASLLCVSRFWEFFHVPFGRSKWLAGCDCATVATASGLICKNIWPIAAMSFAWRHWGVERYPVPTVDVKI